MKQQKPAKRNEKVSAEGSFPSGESGRRLPARFEAFQKMIKEIHSNLSIPILLKRLLRHGMKLSQMESGWIFLWDDGEECLTIQTAANAPEMPVGKKVKLGEDQAGRAAQARTTLVDHNGGEGSLSPGASAERFGTTVAVPLADGEKLIGVLCLGSTDPDRLLPEEILGEMAVLGLHAAVALSHAEAFHSLEELSAKREREATEAERELESLREQLVRKEKLAALGQIVGTVNHELRQPLEVITNAVYYLKMQLERNDIGPIKKDFERFLSIISDECVNTTDLVNELLHFTRKKEAAPLAVDLNQLLESQLQKIQVPDRVKVRKRLDPNLPMIYADPVQLSRSFYNILINAVQAMPKGGTLRLSTETSGGSVVAAVQDSGVGISLEHLKKIFEPLFTTKSKGTGLGLALVKEYIEANRGQIEVQSKGGAGTTFRMTFPSLPAMEIQPS